MEEKQTKQEMTNQTTKKNKQIRTRAILVLIVIFILAIFTYISYRGTYLETIEIGENFKQVFKQNIFYQYATMGINFILLFTAFYMSNRSIKKGLKAFFDEEKKDMPKLPNKSIAFILSALISVAISTFLSEQVARFFNRAWFGIYDPVFGADIGFYLFEKPFVELILFYFMAVMIGITIYATFYYIVIFNKYFDGVNAETLKKSNFFKQMIRNVKILSIGFAGIILIKAQGILTDKFLILHNDASTAIYGAGITDVTIKLWGYRFLAIVLVVSVWMAIRYFKEKKTKRVIISVLAVPAYLVGLFVVMVGFNLIYINSNELDKEKDYIRANIDNTKTAYNIKIDEFDIPNDDTHNLEQIEEHTEVTDHISIVTEEIILKTLAVTQTNTGYYAYRNANISRYQIKGENQLVYVSPREIVSSGDRSYNNKTYEYTHGFGAVVTSATSTDELGNVKYLQKDFSTENQAIYMEEPRIYFGLETNNTIVTNSKNKSEFDYPTTTSQSAEYNYKGQAGLSLNFIDRMILAIRQKDVNLALSSNVTEDSKILINRNILQRAKTILPNVIYDEKPYMVVSKEGRLIWVLDAYTVSNKYPYSQPITIEHGGTRQEINYIRNSLKVLIDAYDGTTKFYITDTTDPIIMSYKNRYPDLFEEQAIPEDIAKHFVYPEFLYNIQAEILQMYHNVSTDVLYRSDDIWEIAKYARTTTQVSSKGVKQEPYYTMLKTIDSEQAELGLVTSYTVLDKQNLKAYLVGTYDEGGNAKLRLYKFPQDTNLLGPMQLETLLGQDETIASELETINTPGMRTIKSMIAVPINNTILYVQPIYQISLNESKSIPTLKKVVVACGNKVAIDDTLKGAIKNLLSQSAVKIEVENTDTIEDLIEAIIKANNNLQTSSNNNDWEMIGKDMKKLQELIVKLEELKEEEDKKKQEQEAMDSQNTIGNVLQNNV